MHILKRRGPPLAQPLVLPATSARLAAVLAAQAAAPPAQHMPDAALLSSWLLRAQLLVVQGRWQSVPAPGAGPGSVAVRHLLLERCKDLTPLLGRMAGALRGSRDFH